MNKCADQKKSGRLSTLGLERDYGFSCLTNASLCNWSLILGIGGPSGLPKLMSGYMAFEGARGWEGMPGVCFSVQSSLLLEHLVPLVTYEIREQIF